VQDVANNANEEVGVLSIDFDPPYCCKFAHVTWECILIKCVIK